MTETKKSCESKENQLQRKECIIVKLPKLTPELAKDDNLRESSSNKRIYAHSFCNLSHLSPIKSKSSAKKYKRHDVSRLSPSDASYLASLAYSPTSPAYSPTSPV